MSETRNNNTHGYARKIPSNENLRKDGLGESTSVRKNEWMNECMRKRTERAYEENGLKTEKGSVIEFKS